MTNNPPRPASLPAGYDEDDPYENEELESYPQWWRANIEQFKEYGMRPYRPPRFRDDEITTETIRRLEANFGVDILIRTTKPEDDPNWTVFVEGEPITSIGRRRSGAGYTVYNATSDEFERLVKQAVDKPDVE